MSSKNKIEKKTKAIFTILTDKLCDDSSEDFYGKQFPNDNKINLETFQFPLNYELQQIHQHPETTQLSSYIHHLENQVKSITNKIEFEYHQARQTVLFIGQSTNLCKLINRKKVDDEFHKMGIIRKYDPKSRKINLNGLEEEELIKDEGDIAIDEIKRKIQVQWESQISDEMEKERRKLREAEKKRQKELEQIDKDFEKIMKKRKFLRDIQTQIKIQQSIKSLQIQNGDSPLNQTPKKAQKRQKIQRRISERNREKNSLQQQQRSLVGSQVQEYQVMDNQMQQSENLNNQMIESELNLKINLLQESNSNVWNHENMLKPNHLNESNELANHEESVNEM